MESILPSDSHINGLASESSASEAANKELTRLKRKWSVYNHGDLKQRVKELGSEKYIINGLIPDRSISLLVGDSGLGKSALVYQMAVSVAAGRPFLGRQTTQGKVLCLDFENGLGQVDGMLDSLYQHLDLSKKPDDLLLWNLNDAPSNFGQKGHTAINLIEEVKPRLVIIDSLTGMYPDIEERNSYAIKYLQQLRQVIREFGTSSLCLHHIKKPSDDPKFAPPPLETSSNSRPWFLQTRGARALINGTDVRLGVDVPQVANMLIGDNKDKEEVALILRGFGRVRGEIPTIYLSRHCDENGEPLGYGVVSGVRLLFNPEQEAALAKLDRNFRFKDARQAYGKRDQAMTDFLNKSIGLGLIRKVGKGYEKLIVAE